MANGGGARCSTIRPAYVILVLVSFWWAHPSLSPDLSEGRKSGRQAGRRAGTMEQWLPHSKRTQPTDCLCHKQTVVMSVLRLFLMLLAQANHARRE